MIEIMDWYTYQGEYRDGVKGILTRYMRGTYLFGKVCLFKKCVLMSWSASNQGK